MFYFILLSSSTQSSLFIFLIFRHQVQVLAGHSGHMADFLREQQALLKEFKACTDLHNQLAKVVMEGQDKINQGVQEVICLLTLLVVQNEGKGKGWAVNPPEQVEVINIILSICSK